MDLLKMEPELLYSTVFGIYMTVDQVWKKA